MHDMIGYICSAVSNDQSGVWRCLVGSAWTFNVRELCCPVSDLEGRRARISSSSGELFIPRADISIAHVLYRLLVVSSAWNAPPWGYGSRQGARLWSIRYRPTKIWSIIITSE